MSKVISYTITCVDKATSVMSKIATSFQGFLGLKMTQYVVQAARASLAYVGAIKDASDATGLSTGNFQALSVAASQNGVKMDMLTQALMRVRDLQSSVGTDERAQKAFAKLGLSISEVAKLSPDQLLKRIATELSKTGDVSAAFDLFGRGAGRMLSTLKELHAADWEGLQGKYKNLIISEADIKAIDEAGDTLDRFAIKLKALGANAIVGVMKGPGTLATLLSPERMAETMREAETSARREYFKKQREERDRAAAKTAADQKVVTEAQNSEAVSEYEGRLFASQDYDTQARYLEQVIQARKKERSALGWAVETLDQRRKLTDEIVKLETQLAGAIQNRARIEEQAEAEAQRAAEAAQKRVDASLEKQQEARDAEKQRQFEKLESEKKVEILNKEIADLRMELSGLNKAGPLTPEQQERKAMLMSGIVTRLNARDNAQKEVDDRKAQTDKESADKRAQQTKALADARAKLADLRRSRSESMDISQEFAWRNFFSGRDPMSMATGSRGGMIRKIGESLGEFKSRRAAGLAEAIKQGRSPDEQAVDLLQQIRDLQAQVAANTGIVPQ